MTAQGVQTLISTADIRARVQALAGEIRRDHPDGVHLVGVLKGAFVFMSDLARALEDGVTLDFIAVSSYGQSSVSSGQPGSRKTPTGNRASTCGSPAM